MTRSREEEANQKTKKKKKKRKGKKHTDLEDVYFLLYVLLNLVKSNDDFVKTNVVVNKKIKNELINFWF